MTAQLHLQELHSHRSHSSLLVEVTGIANHSEKGANSWSISAGSELVSSETYQLSKMLVAGGVTGTSNGSVGAHEN